ncbi:hypothetical protein GGR53DRAFT_485850, partial [Hypoxylon sp. FL1150]
RLCNTIEMTLGRVLGLALGNTLTLATIEKRDRQSFESASIFTVNLPGFIAMI